MISTLLNVNDLKSFLDKSLGVNIVDCAVKAFPSQGFGSTMFMVKAKVNTVKQNQLHQFEVSRMTGNNSTDNHLFINPSPSHSLLFFRPFSLRSIDEND